MLERDKVIEFMRDNPTASASKVAGAFGCSLSAAGKMLQKLRAEGKIPPGKLGGHRPTKPGEDEDTLASRYRAAPKLEKERPGPSTDDLVRGLCGAMERKLELRLELAELDRAIEEFKRGLGTEASE